ncbi:unnamed protein product [Callosobruchus maculatus]|uniref:Transposable element P transposase n=1 Tax=Callosobruchus maculatus TaxID=64391 RepID=A0A653CTM5_CALMS|nr:unnamed protein product [Callosobruchus maculatus]
MDIKQNLEFSKKTGFILGFEDLGEFGSRPVPAKRVLVLMIRGIYSNWKLPVSYYYSENGVRAEVLGKIIKNNLNLLRQCGLKLLGVICDQSTTNQKLFKTLKVTAEAPYFFHDDNKYYALFDTPHLLKSIRNNLLAGDFILHGHVISWNFVKRLFYLDKESHTARALPKITDRQINPNNFQKMSVKLATQIFSHSVAAAMKTTVQTKQLPDEALATANFIEDMDTLFDAMNSKFPHSKNAANRPLSDNNIEVIESLNKGINIMSNLQKIAVKHAQVDLLSPPCFSGIIQTINGIKVLHNDNKAEAQPYILTGRLNQDLFENLFSKYRQRGGYNKNPTVRTFDALFKSNCVNNLLKAPDESNCEPDEDIPLFEQDVQTVDANDSDIMSISSSASETSNPTESLEECSVTYFSGYLANKLLEKFRCEHCKKKLLERKIYEIKISYYY